VGQAAALAAPVVLRVRFADLAEVEAPFRGKDTLGTIAAIGRVHLPCEPTRSTLNIICMWAVSRQGIQDWRWRR
jgi:hypothetical protein